jgi:hypothetical protein
VADTLDHLLNLVQDATKSNWKSACSTLDTLLYRDTTAKDVPSVVCQLFWMPSSALRTRDVFDELPAELVAHIFLIGVWDERHEAETPSVPFNLVVSSVCRRWRHIALTSPLLWQHITMSENEPYPWTQLCLERSKRCPLDIDLFWSESEDGAVFGAEHMSQVMDILQPHVDHWRAFSLSVDAFQPIHHFLSRLTTCTMPILDTLQLYNNCDFDMDTPFVGVEPPIVLPLDVAPRLACLELWGVHLEWDAFAFTHLNHLELSYHLREVQYTVPQLVQILSASPTLETLVFRGSGPFHTPQELGEYTNTLTLPSLRTFRLSLFRDPEQVAFLTMLIRAPKLECLTIEDFFDADYTSVISSLGQPSVGYPSVTHLRMEGIDVPDQRIGMEAFTTLFTALHRVTHLTLNVEEMSEDIFVSLVKPPPTSASKSPSKTPALLLPLLATFQITGAELSSIAFFVSSRQAHGLPIQKLMLNNQDCLGKSDIDMLKLSVNVIEMFDPSDDEGDEDDEGMWEVETESDDDLELLEESGSVVSGDLALLENEWTDEGSVSDDVLDLLGGN